MTISSRHGKLFRQGEWLSRKLLPSKLRKPCIETLRKFILRNKFPVSFVEPPLAATLAQGLEFAPDAPYSVQGPLPPVFTERVKYGDIKRFRLEGALLYNNTALDENYRFIASALPPSVRAWLDARPYMHTPGAIYINSDVTAINTTYLDNYFHFFHDIVAPLTMLPDYKERLYAGVITFDFQWQALEIAGIKKERIINIAPNTLARFKSVEIFSTPEQGHPALIKKLSGIPAKDGFNPQAHSRLYISRDDAKKRRNIDNEPELIALLERYGFKKMTFTGLPVAEQIAIMRSVDYLVIPQGTAVLNLAFCRPSAKVLEFYAPRFLITLGNVFSSVLGNEYHAFIADDA